jgi:hypothetical protein
MLDTSFFGKTHNIGNDGFKWWIGQVEQPADKDGKASNRVKVRIVGRHPASASKLKTVDLPYAHVLTPTNVEQSVGGGSSTCALQEGDWVVGFYLDDDEMQQPLVIGSVNRTALSQTEDLKNNQNPDQTELEFNTFLSPNSLPHKHQYADEQPAPKGRTPGNKQDKTSRDERLTPFMSGVCKAPWSLGGNDAGLARCQELASDCKPEDKLKRTLTYQLKQLFYAVSSGQPAGDRLLSPITNKIYDTAAIATGYIDKISSVINLAFSSVFGYLYAKIDAGIKDLVDLLLNPKTGVLKGLVKTFDQLLDSVGCSMMSLQEQLTDYLQGLVRDLLDQILNPAICAINNIVNSILGFLSGLTSQITTEVLSFTSSILSGLNAGLDPLQAAFSAGLQLLGISCTDPGAEACDEYEAICLDPFKSKKEKQPPGYDTLDSIINSLSSNPQATPTAFCDEAYTNPITDPATAGTSLTLIGTPTTSQEVRYSINSVTVTEGDLATLTVTRYGPGIYENISSLQYTTADGTASSTGGDYTPTNGTLGFSVGETSKNISVQTLANGTSSQEQLYVRITSNDSYGVVDNSDGVINIQAFSPATTPSGSSVITPVIPVSPALAAAASASSYSLFADKTAVAEGDAVTFSVITTNVPDGTNINYQVSGIDNLADVVGLSSFSGTVTISNNSATIPFVIASDTLSENEYITVTLVNLPNGINVTRSVPITDVGNSVPAPVTPINTTPTYALVPSKQSVVEGESFDVNVYTTNIPDGTVFSYSISGTNITSDDILGGALSGLVTINNNQAVVPITISSDGNDLEADETLVFTLVATGVSTSVIIKAPATTLQTVVPPRTSFSTPIPPSAKIITDVFGRIINIPVTPGDVTYDRAPVALIEGDGYGATVKPVLDNRGRLVEIQVLDPGLSYKGDIQKDEAYYCKLTGIEVLNPGAKYTNPKVYVDGNSKVATAIVENGYITGIEVIDDTFDYDTIPAIQIIDENAGSGARAIGQLSCVPREETGVVITEKARTAPAAKYVDCP